MLLFALACRLPGPDKGQDTVPGLSDCEPTTEVPYDGIDQDCDGADLVDVDADGYASTAAGGDDCDDGDLTIHPGEADIPYDGIDQDCSGADLLDADGDGHDGADYGGDDCDELDASIHAGAAEVPYDGIDQDCDGADLLDADGDGHDWNGAGGDDCDDGEATVFPGATEDPSDGLDNDCDSLLDEIGVCWDGTGAYVTIQEGINAAVDGSAVEICSGTYYEYLDLSNRQLTLHGAGATPDDVVLEAPADAGIIYAAGASTDLTIDNVWMRADSTAWYGSGLAPVEGTDIQRLRLDRVKATRTDADHQFVVWVNSGIGGAEIEIERCWLEEALLYVQVDDGTLTVRETYASNVAISAGPLDAASYSRTSLELNNVIMAGASGLYLEGDSRSTGEIEHTDLGASEEFGGGLAVSSCYLYSGGWLDAAACPGLRFDNSVLASAPMAYAWLALGVSGALSVDPAPAYPGFTRTLGWDLGDPLGWARFYSVDYVNGDRAADHVDDDTDVSAYLEGALIWADPLFVVSAERGSYAIDPYSPLIDAGYGDPDADGSPADIGAFGGPDSEWWRTYPWLLP